MSDDKRIWDLMEDERTCMFVTEDAEGRPRARPMHAILLRDRGEIWFYTRLRSGKSDDLHRDGAVCLSFARPSKNEYVSISGHAALSQDRAMIEEHWNTFIDAWFPEGPQGEDVAMIVVKPALGEFWDGESSGVLSALKMVIASRRDETPDLGDNRKVSNF
jgi:general stress protein 26